MELIKGVPITRYCDERCLTPRQRLELFVPVCQAVQHAHQKGIIHRDLKPSNVMIDGDGNVRITDFGIATATGDAGTDIAGTPQYMAPEQESGKVDGIGPAADVYALGAILYELLSGRRAFHELVEVERLVEFFETGLWQGRDSRSSRELDS
jgi:serine/threonine protein kinase